MKAQLENFIPGQNLKDGLKCLSYDKSKTPKQALENSTVPQHVHIEMLTVEITAVNELEDNGVWRFHYKSTWKDERLRWPSECVQEEKAK